MGSRCRRTACVASCAVPTGITAARPIVAVLARAALVIATSIVIAAGILLFTALGGHGQERRGAWAVHHGARLLLHALGIRLDQHGAPRSGPSLVVANHVSFIDLIVLATACPMLPVARAEFADWPLIGLLGRRSGALFMKRERLRELPAQIDRIAATLRRGYRVQVFPEATTGCGSALNPFRRAAFQAAIDAAVVVSPVAVAYRESGGHRTSALAFVGQSTLLASMLQTLRAGPITAEVNWLQVIPAIVGTGNAPTDRAMVAGAAERAIARTLRQPVLRPGIGRPSEPPGTDGSGQPIAVSLGAIPPRAA